MSDEEKSQADNTPVAPQAGQPASVKPAPVETVENLPAWARDVIAELRSENAKHRIAHAESERQARAAKELADKLQADAQRLEQLEKTISDMLASEIASIPERFRGIVPELPRPEQKLEWLRAARAAGLLNPLQAPSTDARGGLGSGEALLTDADRRELAARLGVAPRYLP